MGCDVRSVSGYLIYHCLIQCWEVQRGLACKVLSFRGFTVRQFNCQECWNISVWFNRMAMFGSDILMQGKGSFYSVLVYLIMISINSFQAFRRVIDLLKLRNVSLWDWLSGEDLYRDTINDQFHYRPIVKMVEIAQSQMWTLWNVLLCVIDSLKSKDM